MQMQYEKHKEQDCILIESRSPTICECVYLVRRGHFRSRDEDVSHTIR